MAHTISLSDEQLIYLTEIIAHHYAVEHLAQYARTRFNKQNFESLVVFHWQQEALRDLLAALLRTPLRNPKFKRQMEENFAHHLHDGIRTFGWPWVSEQLVWEVEL